GRPAQPDQVGTIHLPDRRVAGVAGPEDVGPSVAAEIADPGDMPFGAHPPGGNTKPGETGTVHLPDRRLPRAVGPQDVGLAIAVEIAGAVGAPFRAHAGVRHRALCEHVAAVQPRDVLAGTGAEE